MIEKNITDKKGKNTRPPVVVVLGHVDHGKSSLLEAVKNLKITEKEAGGITQHIGAYVISHEGKRITFIDTPGHEAFSKMRSRSTSIADVGVLVVAADESIKEQTKEAIQHLRDADMPFLVAINKIDKKDADIEKVKQDLSKEGIFVESYGGDVPSVDISAKEKIGIDPLLEMILLLAEMEELKEETEDKAQGSVIEVQRDGKRGVVVTLLVKTGVLKKGDIVATESSYGKIRSMENFLGEEMEKVRPSIPAQITGVKGCPLSGEDFFVFEKFEDAKKFVTEKKKNIFTETADEGQNILSIILKADVIGSLEAIEGSLKEIPQKKVLIKIIRSDIGNITESDIEYSKGFDAKVFGFRVKMDKAAEKMAIREEVETRTFQVIYELIEEIKNEAEKIVGEEIIREEKGKAKVLAVFRTQKNRQILGCKITEGEAEKRSIIEVRRNGELFSEGKIINIKKEEKDREKISGKEEFGLLVESKEKIEEGDEIIFYKEEKVKKTL